MGHTDQVAPGVRMWALCKHTWDYELVVTAVANTQTKLLQVSIVYTYMGELTFQLPRLLLYISIQKVTDIGCMIVCVCVGGGGGRKQCLLSSAHIIPNGKIEASKSSTHPTC